VVTRLVKAPRIDFASLRRELELPVQFPLAALREADDAASRVAASLTARADRTDIPFVTIDPATSRDLDQAVSLNRLDGGYRVHYAIADVTAFVPVGGELEAETWRRGETIYLPDGKVPLHPVSLSEGAASLLPDETRPAVLWTIDLDAEGTTTSARLERAIVRSRAKLNYAGVQGAAAAGRLDGPIALLPEVGELLRARALDRGAINLPIPEQELEPDDDGWRLVLRPGLPAEEWNAHISLLTGASAAAIMLTGGLGLLRTMPAPADAAVAKLRTVASALALDWPAHVTPGQMLASVDASTARGAAFVDEAAELLRGAGYTAFEGEAPAVPGHGAVGGPYAHVTAPLRRLGDRYATEVCLSLTANREVPDWVRSALPDLPAVMERSDRRAATAQRGAIDIAEAVMLSGRVGEQFDAAVLDVEERPRRSHEDGASRPPSGVIAIDEPPVRARCQGNLRLGERIRVQLIRADPDRRIVEFAVV
jgi:exoribonuclease R